MWWFESQTSTRRWTFVLFSFCQHYN
uniref:Uncharacterized protein MANES_12G112000 n=1 Tax=Rhizophora mucronata TaxID=61149 RepID=A0A2P2M3A1_RHIMU